MPGELVFSNAQVVTPSEVFPGTVHLRGGTIAAVERGSSNLPAARNLDGDYLIPGLIDVHTDNLERHIMPRNNAEWPVMAALVAHDAQLATAGITTVLDSLCVGTLGAGVRRFEKVKEAVALKSVGRRNCMFRSEHLLHLRVELTGEQTPGMFEQLCHEPDLMMVSLMDHTPGQRQWADLEKYIEMEKRDHKQTEEEVLEHLRRFQENQQKFSLTSRRRILSLLRDRRVALASHDDTTVEHVEEAHADGITISEFPTTTVAAQAARERAMQVVAGAPNLVLGRSHSGNVSVVDLAKLGLVDVLSSDYAPSSLLHGAFLLASALDSPLHEALRTVTFNPARMVGLDDRGSIAEGKRADLIRVKVVKNVPLVSEVWRSGERVA